VECRRENGAVSEHCENISILEQLRRDLLAKGGYDLLCLPAEFEPERRCVTSIGIE
jgi:hypothetical protein